MWPQTPILCEYVIEVGGEEVGYRDAPACKNSNGQSMQMRVFVKKLGMHAPRETVSAGVCKV